MTAKLNQLNALEKKEMQAKADDLCKRRSCRSFTHQEIELLLLSHWNKTEQFANLAINASSSENTGVPIPGDTLTALSLITEQRAGGNKSNKSRGFNRNQFREILHKTFQMTEDLLMDRVFKTFDTTNDGIIDEYEWVEGLAIFLRGDLEDKIAYTFAVYDINGDGYISRDEMFQMLKTCQIRQSTEEDPDEGIKDLVEIALRKMDNDKDSRLSRNDFHDSIVEEPLLLEAFGPCLPDEDTAEKYEMEMFEEIKKNSAMRLEVA